MSRIITEAQPLRDLRDIANELTSLLREQPSQHQVAELAQTAWRKLRDAGPVHDGLVAYFRALPEGRVECLTCDPVEGARPGRVVSVLDLTQWPLWACLQMAEYCPERTYADVRAKALTAEERQRPAMQHALRCWDAAEAGLQVEGLLPVRVLAPPSAAGGARYVLDRCVSNDMLPALRETLAYLDGFILAHWPAETASGRPRDFTWVTLSLPSVDQVWEVASFMVFRHYTEQQEGGAADGQR